MEHLLKSRFFDGMLPLLNSRINHLVETL